MDFLFKDKTKSGTVLLVILLTIGLGGWFGYTGWKEAASESSQWRIANEEMQELLARQPEAKTNPEQSVPTGTKEKAEGASDEPKNAANPASSATASKTADSSGDSKQAGEKGTAASIPSTTLTGKKMNLNTATLQQLDEIPGIGESKAKAIVAHREKLGGKFQSVEQLMDVKGIGEKLLEKMRPYLTLEP
ncbi:ComEA family DNA-binding protein [Paenibacillus sp. NPDC056579]|uniref:ComEA family DNA-binding protein n=1 Tax=Paenibacillus sp. NPDC056579 TaxID=3345871 RepID=UPI0036B01B20